MQSRLLWTLHGNSADTLPIVLPLGAPVTPHINLPQTRSPTRIAGRCEP